MLVLQCSIPHSKLTIIFYIILPRTLLHLDKHRIWEFFVILGDTSHWDKTLR